MGRSLVVWLLALSSLAAPARAQQALDVDRALTRAQALERAGETTAATALLDRILEERSAEPRAILAKERILRRQQRLADLLPDLRRALQAAPRSVMLRQVQLRVLADLGRIDELRAAAQRWMTVSPRATVVYREYSNALRRLGARDEAEKMLLRGRDAIGTPEALASELADLYLSQGRWSDAAGEWATLIHHQPGLGWDLAVYRLESLGTRARPVSEALLTLLSNARHIEERQLAAVAAIYAGRPDRARSEAAAVLARLEDSRRREFADQFASVANDMSRPDLVAWLYRRLLPDVTDASTRWHLTRRIFGHDLSRGDTAAALGLLDDVLAWAEPGAAAHRWSSAWQVKLLTAQADADEARHALERHARLYQDDPEFPELVLAIARAHLREGRPDQASEALDRVAWEDRSGTDAASAAAVRGHTELARGEYDLARAEFESAATALSGPQRSEAIRLLTFLRRGNPRELRTVADAHRERLRGHPLRAADRLTDELEAAPASEARPAMLLWAGELALEGGDLERAERTLRHLAERYPSSGEAPVGLMSLADATADDGRVPAAIDLLEHIIVTYPESALTPVARRRLAELKAQVPRS